MGLYWAMLTCLMGCAAALSRGNPAAVPTVLRVAAAEVGGLQRTAERVLELTAPDDCRPVDVLLGPGPRAPVRARPSTTASSSSECQSLQHRVEIGL